ncbi:hypothetical protein JCM11957_06860 [Caminibacter profundus]
MYIKVKRDVVYKGKQYPKGSILEVGDDLANRMILSGQAIRSNKNEFEQQKKAKSGNKSGNMGDLEKLTVKELEELAKQKGIKLKPKMKKAEIIELIEEASEPEKQSN